MRDRVQDTADLENLIEKVGVDVDHRPGALETVVPLYQVGRPTVPPQEVQQDDRGTPAAPILAVDEDAVSLAQVVMDVEHRFEGMGVVEKQRRAFDVSAGHAKDVCADLHGRNGPGDVDDVTDRLPLKKTCVAGIVRRAEKEGGVGEGAGEHARRGLEHVRQLHQRVPGGA